MVVVRLREHPYTPIHLDAPIYLDVLPYIWTPPICLESPICFDAPICLDAPHIFRYPHMFGCIQNLRHFEKLAFCNHIPTRYPLTDINPIKIQEILNISKLLKHLLPKAIFLTDISFD